MPKTEQITIAAGWTERLAVLQDELGAIRRLLVLNEQNRRILWQELAKEYDFDLSKNRGHINIETGVMSLMPKAIEVDDDL